MVEIGGKPFLGHIPQTHSHHGVNDLIICLGYKSYPHKGPPAQGEPTSPAVIRACI